MGFFCSLSYLSLTHQCKRPVKRVDLLKNHRKVTWGKGIRVKVLPGSCEWEGEKKGRRCEGLEKGNREAGAKDVGAAVRQGTRGRIPGTDTAGEEEQEQETMSLAICEIFPFITPWGPWLPGDPHVRQGPGAGGPAAGTRSRQGVILVPVAAGVNAKWRVLSVRVASSGVAQDAGRRTEKVRPFPARLETLMRPPCCSMIFRQMAKPSPVPRARVV